MTGPRTDLDACRSVILKIEELEHRAHRMGLHATAHALNNAKNCLGWEMAGDVVTAAAAGRGERDKS
jgi:hypothetical protein